MMIWLKVTKKIAKKRTHIVSYTLYYHNNISQYNTINIYMLNYIVYCCGADPKVSSHRQPPTMTRLNHAEIIERAPCDLTDVTL